MAKIFSLFLRFVKTFSLVVTGISTTNPVAQRLQSTVPITNTFVSQIQRTTMNPLSDYDTLTLSAMNTDTLVDLDYTIL